MTHGNLWHIICQGKMHHSERQFKSGPSVNIGRTKKKKKFPRRIRKEVVERRSVRCGSVRDATLVTRRRTIYIRAMPPPLSVPRGASRVCPFSYIETATKPSFSLTEPMLTGLTSYKATWLTYRRSSEGFSKSLFFHTNENFRYVLSFRIAKLRRSADITLNETWSISVDTSECEWVSVCVCTAVRTRHWKENMNTSELFHQTATRIIALWVAWLKHSFNVQQPLCVHNTPPDTPLLSYIPIQKKKKNWRL